MSEPQKAARFNITIPPGLKARMEAAPTENWSAVAARAFEQRLLELESKKEVKGMGDLIARLKAADELDRNDDYQAGRGAGECWAKEQAHPKQLRNILRLRNLRRSVDEFARDLPSGLANVAHQDAALGAGPGVGWHIYFGMLGRPEANGAEVKALSVEADAFWRDVLGKDKDRIKSVSFGQGFVDGALAVWDQVKDQLE